MKQFLYTYRYMSDEDLRDYVGYYNSPPIQAFSAAVVKALSEAIR